MGQRQGIRALAVGCFSLTDGEQEHSIWSATAAT